MNINQTATHLERLNQPFDVIVVHDGVERTLYANQEPINVQSLLEEVVSAQNPDKLIIQERKRNGSVNKKTENYPVNMDSGLSGVGNTTSALAGLQQPVSFNAPSDYKDYILRDLEKKLEKAERTIDKLETDNDRLKRENFELDKENQFKDKDFDYVLKSKELEQTSGLNGVLETVSSNPALANIMGMAVGRLMGVDMPTQELPQTENNETEQNSLQGEVAKHISTWIKQQNDEVTKKFYRMVNVLTDNVDKIDSITKFLTNLKEKENAV